MGPIISLAFAIVSFNPTLQAETSKFGGCTPGKDVGGSAPVQFGENGDLMVDWTNPSVLATRRVNKDVVQVAYQDNFGKKKFLSIDEASKVREQMKNPATRSRSVITVRSKDGKPQTSTIARRANGKVQYKQQRFEYDKDGRCRIAQNVAYNTKDGKINDVIVTSDAKLCDKIEDLQKKNANLAMCKDVMGELAKAFTEHAKSYGKFNVDVALKSGVKSTEVAAAIGSIDPATGMAVAVNPKSVDVMMRKVAECNISGGKGLGKAGLYGTKEFVKKAKPSAVSAIWDYSQAGPKGEFGTN